MLAKRIIPCLDIKDGRTVKGINFVGLKDAGDPVQLAKKYSDQGADELVFLDITATDEKRRTLVELVSKVAREINIPFTVGGGISSIEDADAVLQAGADKISINSAAMRNPELINALAAKFGSQCVVLAIDAKPVEDKWVVYLSGGKVKTARELIEWAKEGVERGAGEILFTSMGNDGTKKGFAIQALDELTQSINVPVIASGGAGNIDDFVDVFNQTSSDAALAASIFHYDEISIPELKNELDNQKIFVRK